MTTEDDHSLRSSLTQRPEGDPEPNATQIAGRRIIPERIFVGSSVQSSRKDISTSNLHNDPYMPHSANEPKYTTSWETVTGRGRQARDLGFQLNSIKVLESWNSTLDEGRNSTESAVTGGLRSDSFRTHTVLKIPKDDLKNAKGKAAKSQSKSTPIMPSAERFPVTHWARDQYLKRRRLSNTLRADVATTKLISPQDQTVEPAGSVANNPMHDGPRNDPEELISPPNIVLPNTMQTNPQQQAAGVPSENIQQNDQKGNLVPAAQDKQDIIIEIESQMQLGPSRRQPLNNPPWMAGQSTTAIVAPSTAELPQLSNVYTQSPERTSLLWGISLPKKENEPKPRVPKYKGPVDVEKQCAVPLPNGSLCARSLTCKSHSMGAKRAVPGRSLPFDALIANYQRRNKAKSQGAGLDALRSPTLRTSGPQDRFVDSNHISNRPLPPGHVPVKASEWRFDMNDLQAPRESNGEPVPGSISKMYMKYTISEDMSKVDNIGNTARLCAIHDRHDRMATETNVKAFRSS